MTKEADDLASQLPALRRFALVLTRDPHEAEDLVQDALLRGHERRRGFRAGGNLKGWLFSILKNAFVDRHRHRTAREGREAAFAGLEPLSLEAPQEAVVRLSQLRAAFLALSEDQREALSLIAIEGLSYAEAAEVAGVPLGTLMSRVARARASLRAFEAGQPGPIPSPIPGDTTAQAGTHAAGGLRLVGGRDAGSR